MARSILRYHRTMIDFVVSHVKKWINWWRTFWFQFFFLILDSLKIMLRSHDSPSCSDWMSESVTYCVYCVSPQMGSSWKEDKYPQGCIIEVYITCQPSGWNSEWHKDNVHLLILYNLLCCYGGKLISMLCRVGGTMQRIVCSILFLVPLLEKASRRI